MLETRFFGDSHEFNFELTLNKRYWFFGIKNKIEKVNYTISMFQSIKTHKDHWDEMIKNKTPIC